MGYTASSKKPGMDLFSIACVMKRKLSSSSASSSKKVLGPDNEHSRTAKNYVHMCEGRLFVQVKNRIKTSLWALVEDWSIADAALEGIKRSCCYCRDRQGVPEAHCGGEERVLVGVHGAV